MRKILAGLVALLLLGASPSRADTDYTCLNACMNNGGVSITCLPKCSYDSSPARTSGAVPAHTDYACLKTCVDGGQSSATCFPQCTNASAQGVSPVAPHTPPATHNQFKAPVPVQDVILSTQSHGVTHTGKDFDCMNLCMHSGMQYQLCEQHCTQ